MSNDHEWLNLVEVSGPFLAVPVLRDVFPQGLEALPSGRSQRLRRTYEEWRDAVDMDDLDLPALHAAWINDVLLTALEMDDTVLRKGATLPERLRVSMPEHGVTVAPDLAVVNPTNSDEPLLLIHIYEPDTDLDAIRRFDGLAITPADRMVALLRTTGCPTGVVTNGERWMLVNAPVGAVAGFASWYARLWGQEPETLRAFVSLLGVRRFFGPDEGKLPALYDRSLKHQDDVTEALGEQVRRAVEVLVQALDRADQDRSRELLRDVDPRELYEAGLTVMMRLVFLLAAEERALLLLGDPRYDSFYAISSLRMQLRAESEEILERRRSAWSRLLALFRGVYGGIDHPTLLLPALGGSLFDPDRYPFLEGRKKGTSWRNDPAEPLPIDDRTVLLLLDAIQIFEGRTLSYRALDVEQIGHVYEGLLERTVKRVDDITLELDSGAKAKSPRVTLGEMGSARLDGPARVAELLKERSERWESAIRNALGRAADDRLAARLLTVCRGDVGLRDRILPYAPLLRTDPWGYPLVHHKGAFIVVLGADRRESGTHYTPKSLTEKIVAETLTPVAYRGPAEGKAPEEWELKSTEELLDLKICDPAMGSGAFLVQACRWLSDRLVEAWSATEATGKQIDSEGLIVESGSAGGFDPLSQDVAERAIVARRLVAERCLYGVDKNPLAVELAKLSLWLTTMSKGRPVGFLDHNLRSGDSLLGIHDIRQLTELSMAPKGSKQLRLFGRSIESAVERAIELRNRLRAIPIRDIGDVDAMAALDAESRRALLLPQAVADAFVGIILAEARATERADRLQALEALADAAANGTEAAVDRLRRDSMIDLSADAPDGQSRDPFHWPIEFPETFIRQNPGFDALIGNPPFMGGSKIATSLGMRYKETIIETVANSVRGRRGQADFCMFFLLRLARLSRRTGCFGLISTNSIAQGDSRIVGLDQLVDQEFKIFSAEPNFPWPGSASVVVSIVSIASQLPDMKSKISGMNVKGISALLLPMDESAHPPKTLKENRDQSFEGYRIEGQGFVLTPDEAQEVIDFEPQAIEVIKPYLRGDDFLKRPDQSPAFFVIDFGTWPLSREAAPPGYNGNVAEDYPTCLKIVEERVKPQRMALPPTPKINAVTAAHWWRYRDTCPALRAALDRKKPTRVLFHAFTSKHIAFGFAESDYVFAAPHNIFVFDDYAHFAVLQSSIHVEWAFRNCSTLGSTLRYTRSSIFDTFPFPDDLGHLEDIGERFYQARSRIMKERDIGLRDIYNLFHSSEVNEADIESLRLLQREMDLSVINSYGWNDIEIEYCFSEAPTGSKFSFSGGCLDQLMSRLLKLNFERSTSSNTSSESTDRSRAPKKTPGDDLQSDLFQEQIRPIPKSIKIETTSSSALIETFLRGRRTWLSKSDILAYVDVPDGQWNAAINDLLENGIVERQGERRGARYRISESD